MLCRNDDWMPESLEHFELACNQIQTADVAVSVLPGVQFSRPSKFLLFYLFQASGSAVIINHFIHFNRLIK